MGLANSADLTSDSQPPELPAGRISPPNHSSTAPLHPFSLSAPSRKGEAVFSLPDTEAVTTHPLPPNPTARTPARTECDDAPTLHWEALPAAARAGLRRFGRPPNHPKRIRPRSCSRPPPSQLLLDTTGLIADPGGTAHATSKFGSQRKVIVTPASSWAGCRHRPPQAWPAAFPSSMFITRLGIGRFTEEPEREPGRAAS